MCVRVRVTAVGSWKVDNVAQICRIPCGPSHTQHTNTGTRTHTRTHTHTNTHTQRAHTHVLTWAWKKKIKKKFLELSRSRPPLLLLLVPRSPPSGAAAASAHLHLSPPSQQVFYSQGLNSTITHRSRSDWLWRTGSYLYSVLDTKLRWLQRCLGDHLSVLASISPASNISLNW